MKRRLQKAGIILSILLVILAAGYFAGTWYLKQKNEDTKQTTAQADGQKTEADKEQEAGARSDLQTEYDTSARKNLLAIVRSMKIFWHGFILNMEMRH